MADLVLPVKREYFEQIKRGEKTEEYRQVNNYWIRRLYEREDEYSVTLPKHFDHVVITLGYPKADDTSRRLVFPWRGFKEITITHPHFGPDPVQVFAITLQEGRK